MADILIIDGNISFATQLEADLLRHELSAASCNCLARAMGMLHMGNYKIVLIGDELPDGNCLDFLATIREIPSFPEVIIISRNRDPDVVEQAIENGAWNYMIKPPNMQRLLVHIHRIIEYQTEKSTTGIPVSLRREGIVGNSRLLLACLDTVAQAAATDSNVLLFGETGTGKELFARAIHRNSAREKKPFVVVDCAALPDTLAENLLFGHERGAYTSADHHSIGLIKQADGGTLFLDEIGELPISMQKVFLRVLEGRSFRPVGGVKEVTSNFRLLAATNRNLEEMVQREEFRRDLFYRLLGIQIQLPPLRAIAEDINELACNFIRRHCQRLKIEGKGFSSDFLDALMQYEWPGNIRELMNTIEQAIAQAGKEAILYPRHLPKTIRAQLARRALGTTDAQAEQETEILKADTFPDLKSHRKQQIVELETQYLKNLMRITLGNIEQSCRIAGLSRARLYALLKRYDIARP